MISGVADIMNGIALIALFQGMQGQEMLPVSALLRGQKAAAVAQWAVMPQGRKYGLADEFRLIGDLIKLPGQFFVSLEGKNTFLSFDFHAYPLWCEKLFGNTM